VPLVIDREAKSVIVNGTECPLSPRQFSVLELLATGRVVTRAELIQHAGLQGLSDRRCEGILLGLRKIIGDDAIVNLRKRGWRLLPETELVD